MSSSPHRILIYLLRRDLRLVDNPIFHELSRMHSQSQKPFTHLIPLYVFPAQQVEVSGFISGDASSPYPPARSQTGSFWRCGATRAKFLAESVWDLKQNLEGVGSGMCVRAGMVQDVVKHLMEGIEEDGSGPASKGEVTGLWMTEEVAIEEKREERALRKVVEGKGKEFKVWKDEKYFIDDRDLPFDNPKRCPDVFTTYKNQVSPLRDAPRKTHPKPTSLPPLPSNVPAQSKPFSMPSTLDGIIDSLQKPLLANPDLRNPPKQPKSGASTAIPFPGGERPAYERLIHLLKSGAMSRYKDTRNGMLGVDFSSKFSAFLALGSITARQVHWAMSEFEDGMLPECQGAQGYGKGENKGTAHMRFELLWRDYMRLVTRKFGPMLFHAEGFKNDQSAKWNYNKEQLMRWLEGTTGMGLVDASQRELFLTGYTSNRARQNVASFLAKHLGLDWRLGAEWYEQNLVDFDVSSNWGNWQYTAGVGNDPREGGGGRKFNPVKQASDYDKSAEYIKAWVPEVRGLDPQEAWQCWKASGERGGLGIMAEEPLVRIEYTVGKGRNGPGGGGGGGRGGRGRGGPRGRGKGRSGFSKRDVL